MGSKLLSGQLPLQLPPEVPLCIPEHGGPLVILLRRCRPPLPGGLLNTAHQSPQGVGHLPLHPQLGRPLVHEVNGLVRQEAVGEVPPGQHHRRLQGPVGDDNAVVGLIPGADALQDLQGLLRGGLPHPHGLEAPLQGGVLLDILAVLLQGGGPHHLDLTPAQGGLQDVGSINGPLRRARAHNVVQLVQKEDDVACPVYLRQDLVYTIFKFTPVLGARHHGHQVQGQKSLAPQHRGHLSGGHTHGQALGHGGFAHPRLSHQGGIVFGAPGEDLHHPAHLLVPSNEGVQGSHGRQTGEVPGIAVGELGLPTLPHSGPFSPGGLHLSAPPRRVPGQAALLPHWETFLPFLPVFHGIPPVFPPIMGCFSPVYTPVPRFFSHPHFPKFLVAFFASYATMRMVLTLMMEVYFTWHMQSMTPACPAAPASPLAPWALFPWVTITCRSTLVLASTAALAPAPAPWAPSLPPTNFSLQKSRPHSFGCAAYFFEKMPAFFRGDAARCMHNWVKGRPNSTLAG